jgi:hypothetical protein
VLTKLIVAYSKACLLTFSTTIPLSFIFLGNLSCANRLGEIHNKAKSVMEYTNFMEVMDLFYELTKITFALEWVHFSCVYFGLT